MKKKFGYVDGHFETGTEGVMWIFFEDGKEGYDAMIPIKKGDHLTIFAEDGSKLFDGEILPDRRAGWTEYPLNAGHGQPSALGCWVHWTQGGWEPDEWAKFFMHSWIDHAKAPLRAELVPAPEQP